jgi:anaerobic ribonucleoside-triphosphate reductase activating protein
VPEFFQLHHFEPSSRVNGPGERAVVWLQGCTLGCPQCFNPETHSKTGGIAISVDDLLTQVKKLKSIEGITFSGGEPLQQIRPLISGVSRIRHETDLSVLIFTGFTWDEARRIPGFDELSKLIDVLIAGRYWAEKRLAHSLIGSTNKSLHFLTSRYTIADLEAVPEAEVMIDEDGSISFSGIDPVQWK